MKKLGSLSLVFVIVSLVLTSTITVEVKANPGYEDYTSYDEVDVGANHLQFVGTDHLDFDSYNNEDVYLSDSKGIDHFNNDFEHIVDILVDSVSATTARAWVWALTNIVDDLYTVRTTDDLLGIGVDKVSGGIRLFMYETLAGTPYYDLHTYLVLDTPYYLKIKRDENVGTYGTLYCGIYSTAELRDAGDGTDGDIDNLILTLHEKEDFEYVYACSSPNSGGAGQWMRVDIDNLDLQEAVGEYTEEFSETVSPSASLYLWKALSEKYLETITVTATSYGWREKASFYTETTTITEQHYKWIELRRFFTESITVTDQMLKEIALFHLFTESIVVTETATFTMEILIIITEFTETINIDASLILWKAKQIFFLETISPLANFYDWIELKMTIVEFIDTIEINALMDLTTAAPLTIEGVYALAAIAFIIAIVALVIVVTKKD